MKGFRVKGRGSGVGRVLPVPSLILSLPYRRFSDFWPRMSTILQNCGCFLPSHLSLPSQCVWSLLIWGILWAPRKAQHP